jgi:proteasome accessory factor A
LVNESIALVRCAAVPRVALCWDYGGEDPHLDAHGFHVAELRQDADEANYVAQDMQRELTHAEIKNDLVLSNGARFYNDHAHPEYCTPECSSLHELIVHDRAGDRILMACAQDRSEQLGSQVRLYKNNTDFNGHSYGCHENYLLPRSLPWETLAQGMLAFLVTRQIIAGAGKFALEAEDRFLSPGFQISQRSDFFSELQSVDTMQRRPLINTRDEPHANPQRYRRFHVILGDANMSPFATRLKVGTTALVLEALVRNPHAPWPVLEDPLTALHSLSCDTSFRWELYLQDHRLATALDVQRAYLDAVRASCDFNAEKAKVFQDWETVLDDLDQDVMRCRDRLDWVAKLGMIRDFQAAHGLADSDPWLTSLDLEYHCLDLDTGLYYALERTEQRPAVPPEEEVRYAMANPPETTRAYIRGKCVQKFAAEVLSAQWDYLLLRGRYGPIKISLRDLFAPEEIMRYAKAVDNARSPDDLRCMAEP